MLTRKLFCEEGRTDTNAYWEALLLRKAGQTPMLTGKLFCRGRLDGNQCLLGGSSAEEGRTDTNAYWEALLRGRQDRHQCLLGSSSAEEGWMDTNVYWEAPLLKKAGETPMVTGKLF